MSKIQCIYCGKIHDKMKDTVVLKQSRGADDSEVRRLDCKQCGKQHMYVSE